MDGVHSIEVGDIVRCASSGIYILPVGLPAGAFAEVVARFFNPTYGSVTYVCFDNKLFKVAEECIHPVLPTFTVVPKQTAGER